MLGYLESFNQAIKEPLDQMVTWITGVFPNLILALIVVFIGYMLGFVLGFVLEKLLSKFGLDKWMKKAELSDALGHLEMSHFAGLLLKWYVVVLFLDQALKMADFGIASILVNKLTIWLPNLVVAIIIILIGLIVADYVFHHMSRVKHKHVRTTAIISRFAIIIFTVIIALDVLALYSPVFIYSFLIMVASLGLALGIGFGLALKDEAAKMIKGFKSKK